MGHTYKNLEEFERDFPFLRSGSQPDKFKVFLIGETSETRLTACNHVKGVLDRMLNETQRTSEIKSYEVDIIDLADGKKISKPKIKEITVIRSLEEIIFEGGKIK